LFDDTITELEAKTPYDNFEMVLRNEIWTHIVIQLLPGDQRSKIPATQLFISRIFFASSAFLMLKIIALAFAFAQKEIKAIEPGTLKRNTQRADDNVPDRMPERNQIS
jgi:hypothetical protein